MDIALLIARLLLALVFVVAGVAKLADRSGSRRAMTDFGVPSALAAPLGILLPLAELATAAALVLTSTALWGALGALALLLLFVLGISLSLARGNKPECHCFGQLSSAPAGWKTLARNGVLAVLAGFVVWQGWEDDAGPSAVSWLWALSGAQLAVLLGGLVLLGLVAAQWSFLVHLLRQNGRLLVRVEALEEDIYEDDMDLSRNGGHPGAGLPVGTPAPDFSLQGLYGETLTLEALRAAEKPVLLFFTAPDCGPCTALLPEIRRWQKDHAEELTISLISRGSLAQNRAKSTEHGLRSVLMEEEWEVTHSYEVRGTPSAVLVRPDGTIGSPLASGAEAIKALVAWAVEGGEAPTQLPMQAQGSPCPNCGKVHPNNGHAHAAQGPKIGEPAPPIELQDLSGKNVRLEDFRGEETLVLFWNPGCGFCQQMLEDLKAWEADPPGGTPRFLVVSAGTQEANEDTGLGSPVLLDQNFEVGRAFGAMGTPSAVLVDEEGKVASEVAVGAPAVFELAGASRAEA